MERKKAKIIELPILEKEILEMCIFQESFGAISEECQSEKNRNIIADAIKNLIHYKLLVPTNMGNSLTWVYDSDQMQESSFKATALGIDWMEKNS